MTHGDQVPACQLTILRSAHSVLNVLRVHSAAHFMRTLTLQMTAMRG